MRRPQFSLKTLLWLMAVVAAFYAGRRSRVDPLHEQREALRIQAAAVDARQKAAIAEERAIRDDAKALAEGWQAIRWFLSQTNEQRKDLKEQRQDLVELDREVAKRESSGRVATTANPSPH